MRMAVWQILTILLTIYVTAEGMGQGKGHTEEYYQDLYDQLNNTCCGEGGQMQCWTCHNAKDDDECFDPAFGEMETCHMRRPMCTHQIDSANQLVTRMCKEFDACWAQDLLHGWHCHNEVQCGECTFDHHHCLGCNCEGDEYGELEWCECFTDNETCSFDRNICGTAENSAITYTIHVGTGHNCQDLNVCCTVFGPDGVDGGDGKEYPHKCTSIPGDDIIFEDICWACHNGPFRPSVRCWVEDQPDLECTYCFTFEDAF